MMKIKPSDKKILIVDDNAEIRNILRTFLEGVGYNVCEAKDGTSAVSKARHDKPDLIIMDCMMPFMDGWEACRQIRKDPEIQETPVIMCTSKDSVKDIEISLAAGATDYVTKPIDMDRLLKNVNRALSGFRLGQ